MSGTCVHCNVEILEYGYRVTFESGSEKILCKECRDKLTEKKKWWFKENSKGIGPEECYQEWYFKTKDDLKAFLEKHYAKGNVQIALVVGMYGDHYIIVHDTEKDKTEYPVYYCAGTVSRQITYEDYPYYKASAING